ncbi:MAG: glycerophosphodiester phosphodiesterase [Dehalococcoidia bacterium]
MIRGEEKGISSQNRRAIINIAHRGYSRDFPENTLEAFKAAIELGVDGIEFDVQETADGEFFIFHNDDIEGKKIAEMQAADIGEIRIGRKYRVPALEETLSLCAPGLILIVELKQVKSLEKFLAILRDHIDVTRVVIVSFDSGLISRLASLAPDIMRAVITSAPVDRPEEITTNVGSAAIGLRCQDVNAESVSRLRRNGTMVFVWGCPDAQAVWGVMRFDIDGVISDFPDAVKEGNADRD